MYFILILILIAALAYLVYKQTQSERQWQAELEQHQKNQPRYKIIDGYQPEPQPEQLELPVEIEPEPEAQPAPTLPNNGIAFTLIDDAAEASAPAAEQTPPAQQPENVITLEEATRNMLRAAATQAAEQPEILIDHRFQHAEPNETAEHNHPHEPQTQPENPQDEEIHLDFSALHTYAQPHAQLETQPARAAEIITPQEATRLHHHTLSASENPVAPDVTVIEDNRTPQDEVNRLLENNFIAASQTQPENEQSALSHNPNPGETEIILPAANLETIDFSDIQDSLAKQQTARRLKQQAEQNALAGNLAPLPEPQPWASTFDDKRSLKTIPEREIWANLSHTDTPAARKHQAENAPRFTTQANRLPLPVAEKSQVAFQAASAPIASVAIPAPTIVEPSPLPAPEIIEPANFYQAQAAETRKPEEPEAFAGRFCAPDAANYPARHANPSEASLTKADFAAYYAQQGQPEIDPSQGYILPPLSLLSPAQHNPEAVQSQEELLENSITIEEKLGEYRVKVKVLDAYAGPVITRYEIEPDVGVRGSSVTNLEKDLARSLGVTAIRVVETIPGKTCMGLELPNPKRQTIRLREVFDSPAFASSHSKLTLALGEDITGEPVVTDLAKAPHLLVAGTTGSGKSVGVNSMILSMLYKATPEDVRLIMIDPKMLELSVYQDIPHLLAPVVTDMKHAANALNWCVNEMEKRYRLMSHVGVRNLAGYNEKIAEAAARGEKIANPFSFTPNDPEPLEKLPFIVVVVDEFADLMMVAGKQIEQLIARLAQKARAAGIHLILATQRPSVDVITGLIKANIPTRIAFQVSSKIDSRTVLDQMGAENLLGQGDMLFLPPGTGYPQRVHGAFVADEEVHRVVDYLKQFGEPDYVEEILSPEQAEFSFDGSPNSGSSNEKDPLFDQAVEVIVRTQKATISSLQRHLRIGYNKAATIIDQLEAEGIVSAADHSGKRKILARKGDD
ncbi:DNA translocase FtsK [Kingella oralis]|uniref:DNA translocase FtsK n=1 Tax=Kingella oralis TaxID=505 RepID=UPI002D7EB82B|nr:DNA translocase FtsK [Kingella oralis]